MFKNQRCLWVIVSALLLIPHCYYGQIYTDEQIARFPQGLDPLCVHPLPDSTYIIGLQQSPYGEWGFLQTDKNGRSLGGYVTNIQSPQNSIPRSMVTSDGALVFTSRKELNGSRTLAAKYDLNGNVIWGLQFPDNNSDQVTIYDILPLDSGAVIFSGLESTTQRAWMAKVNATGLIVWAHAYTGTFTKPFLIAPGANGEFYGCSQYSNGVLGLRMCKFDASGLPIWNKEVSSALNVFVSDFTALPHGKFAILNSYSNSGPTILAIMDGSGNALNYRRITNAGGVGGHVSTTRKGIVIALPNNYSIGRHQIVVCDTLGNPLLVTKVNHSDQNGSTDDRVDVCPSVDGAAAVFNTNTGLNLILTDSLGSYPCAYATLAPAYTSSSAGTFTVTPPTVVAPLITGQAISLTNMFGLPTNSQTVCTWCPTPPPTAAFTYQLNGLTVDFHNTSSNWDSLRWDLGDGIASTDSTPTVTYATEGQRNVCLVVYAGCWADSLCLTVPAVPRDVQALHVLNTNLAPGSNSISMSFRNGSSDTLQSLQLSYQMGNLATVTEPWSGTLLPGDTAAYTFSTPATINLTHRMDITVWAKFPVPTLGNNPANDTARKSICMTLAGSYDIGGGNQDISSFAQAMLELRDCGQHGPVVLRLFGYPQGPNLLGGYTAAYADSNGLYPIKVTYGNGPLQDTLWIAEVFRCKRMSFVGLTIIAEVSAQVSCDGARFIRCEDIVVDSCAVYNKSLAFRGTKNFTVTNSHFAGLYGVSTIDQYPATPPYYPNTGTGTISNNVFEVGLTAMCIDGDQRSMDLVIDHNIAHNPWRGLEVMSDQNLKSMTFSNNQIDNATNAGIRMGLNCPGCINTAGVELSNNMVSMVDANVLISALDVRAYSPLEVVHNSFIGYCNFSGGSASVQNNIFASQNYACVDYSNAQSFDYNCYYPMDSSTAFASSAPTFMALLTSHAGNFHSFTADPGYVSNSDLHTLSTNVVDRGISLPGYTADIDGDAWSSPPDVGADENGLVSSNDDGAAPSLQVWPTCFGDELHFRLPAADMGGITQLRLIAMDGRQAAATAFEGNEHRWNLPSLPAGFYALKMDGPDGHSVTLRVVRQ
ncbi:MAG: hypothetical protein U0176_13145 [Bacteroidia bacterium]